MENTNQEINKEQYKQKKIKKERKIRNIFAIFFVFVLLGRIIIFFFDKKWRKIPKITRKSNTESLSTKTRNQWITQKEKEKKEILLQSWTANLSSQEKNNKKEEKDIEILIPEKIETNKFNNNTAILFPIINDINTEKKEKLEKIKEIKNKEESNISKPTLIKTTKIENWWIKKKEKKIIQKRTKEISNSEKKKQQELQKEKIKKLEKIYKEKKQKKDFQNLINELIKNYDFAKANDYLKNYKIRKDWDISPSLIIYSHFNTLDFSNSSDLYAFSQKIKDLKNQWIISHDEYCFYQGILALEKQNYTAANEQRKKLTTEKYTTLTKRIENIQEQMKNKKGMPKYYQDALVAVEFLKAGYFSIAKHLAIQVLNQNKKYSLPYQILAYNDFLTNNLSSAIGYFQQLTKIDPAKHNSYKYMMGISYYWNQDYSNAILHLSQLKNINEFRTDVLRYLILAYEKIHDDKRIIENYKELLKEKNLREADFVEFFDNFLIQPYQTKWEITLNEAEKNITQELITRCKTEKNINQGNCSLGEIGLRIAKNTRNKETKDMIEKLVNQYQQSFLDQALGDYYYRRNDFPLAKKWYLKASLATEDKTEILQIKEKLLRLEQESL